MARGAKHRGDGKKARQTQQRAQPLEVAGGPVLRDGLAVLHDEPSLFQAAAAGHSHPAAVSERGSLDDRIYLPMESDGPMPVARRCAAAGCRVAVEPGTAFCAACALLIPADLRRALIALGPSRADELLRLQAARAIAVKQGRPTVFFDGAIRRVEHGRAPRGSDGGRA